MNLPRHVAIIMDGNGRWAKKRGYPRFFGHVRGCSRVREVVIQAVDLGIEALTLYAFSTENWKRPEKEVEVLWKLLKKFLIRDQQELMDHNIQLRVIGDLNRISLDVRQVLDTVLDRLKDNTGLRLTFALSYGSRSEITQAASRFAKDCIAGLKVPDQLNEDLFQAYLYDSPFVLDVDLFIRTSGEKRVSNFLLWQSAYAEFVFDPTLWPDFGAKHLVNAIHEYTHRERRFGTIYPSSPYLLQQLS